jgi:hypothetical protein
MGGHPVDKGQLLSLLLQVLEISEWEAPKLHLTGGANGVEPTGLEPVTPCLQSDGGGLVERRLNLTRLSEPRPPLPRCPFVAAVFCCSFPPVSG